MSRIGKKPVEIPSGVTVNMDGRTVTVSGPKGELVREIVPEISVEVKDNQALILRQQETQRVRALHGLFRSLIDNMVTGVSSG